MTIPSSPDLAERLEPQLMTFGELTPQITSALRKHNFHFYADTVERAAQRIRTLVGEKPTDDVIGIVAQALYDVENTARLSEHPEEVPAYRHKAEGLIRWITILGGNVAANTPTPPPEGVELDLATMLAALDAAAQVNDELAELGENRSGTLYRQAASSLRIQKARAEDYAETVLEISEALGCQATRHEPVSRVRDTLAKLTAAEARADRADHANEAAASFNQELTTALTAANSRIAELATDVVALAEHCGELADLSDGPCEAEVLCGAYACEQVGCIKLKADNARTTGAG